MKLILADLTGSKTVILTILEALNFEFFGNFTLENVKNSKPIAAIMVKMAVFDILNQPNLISRKIRVTGKLLNFHTVSGNLI